MELRDDQPTQHEIGNRTYLIAPVEPLDVEVPVLPGAPAHLPAGPSGNGVGGANGDGRA